jgi:glycosyltransferase involved in cell wall biosynthesis
VLMEAMAMELPVVATRVGGVPELVEDGVSGRLVAPGSARELADALAEVSGSIGSLSQWRHAARRTVERQYNTAELGARMASLLERYAERARPEPRLLPKLAHAAYARVGIVLATLACCL